MVNNGVSIILKSRDKGSFKIVPVEKDDTLISEEEFFAKLDKSMQQIKEGKSKTFTSAQELQNYIYNNITGNLSEQNLKKQSAKFV